MKYAVYSPLSQIPLPAAPSTSPSLPLATPDLAALYALFTPNNAEPAIATPAPPAAAPKPLANMSEFETLLPVTSAFKSDSLLD